MKSPARSSPFPPSPYFRTGVAWARLRMPQMFRRVTLVAEMSVCTNGWTCHNRCCASSTGRNARSQLCAACSPGRAGKLSLRIATLLRRRCSGWSLQFQTRSLATFFFALFDDSCFSGRRFVSNNGYVSKPCMKKCRKPQYVCNRVKKPNITNWCSNDPNGIT